MTSTTSRRITILKPVPCEVCGDKHSVLISAPGSRHAVMVPCLACVWWLPIVYPRAVAS